MMQILGAVLVAGCGIWFGNRQARQLSRRVQVLEGLKAALEQVKRELELRGIPLPRLFRELSKEVPWPADALFSACAISLERDAPEGLAQVWTSLTGQIPHLTEEERRLLASLGQVLGRYPGPAQGEAIVQVCHALEPHIEAAQSDSRRLGRVYRAVGAAGGGFLVILLL